MENFKVYGMAQFAMGNDAKFKAFVALALDMVAAVQQWDEQSPRKTKAEMESALSIALTVAKVPETSARRVLATVSGLALAFTRDHKALLESLKEGMARLGDNNDIAAEATESVVSRLKSEGVENLSFLETYARKGMAGVAGLAAEFAAKAEARAKREAMTEAEAAEAAKAEAEAAEAAKAEQSPRAKAAKQAAAILASLAKHADNMTDAELSAIQAALADIAAKRKAIETAINLANSKAEQSPRAKAA